MKINKVLDIGLAYSAFLFSLLLLFSIKFANIALIIFYFFCILHFLAYRPTVSKKKMTILRVSALLLLVSIVFSIFSGLEFQLLLNGLGRRITFLLSPLAFLILSKQSIKTIKEKALWGIVIGVFGSSVFLISNILYEYFLTRPLFSIDTDLFNFYHTNTYFTRILDIHPTYYGIVVLTGLGVIYFYKRFKSLSVNIVFVTLNTIVLLFLNARIVLLLVLILHSIFLIKYFFGKTRRILISSLLTVGVLVLFGVLLFSITKNTYAYQRVFKESIWEFSDEANSNYNFKSSGESRMSRWQVALDVIKKEPILGYGVFKEKEILEQEYKALNMKNSYTNKYNAHNQFLGFAIEGGVLSAVALFFFLSANLYVSIKNKEVLYFFIVLSVFSVCLVENYLTRNAGIIFTSFFSSLFLFNTLENGS